MGTMRIEEIMDDERNDYERGDDRWKGKVADGGEDDRPGRKSYLLSGSNTQVSIDVLFRKLVLHGKTDIQCLTFSVGSFFRCESGSSWVVARLFLGLSVMRDCWIDGGKSIEDVEDVTNFYFQILRSF